MLDQTYEWQYSKVANTCIGFFRFDWPHSRMSNIRQPKRPSSDVGFSTFDQPSVECRIFDIRNTLLRMSSIRHSKHPSSDRIFSIRSAVRRMSNIRHPKCVRRMQNNRHPKHVRSNDGFVTFDRRSMQFAIFNQTLHNIH